MTGLTYHFFLHVLVAFATFSGDRFANGSTTLSCNEIESKSAILRLRKYLFCDYDQTVRPTTNYKNATIIRFGLLPQSIEVDSDASSLELHTWTSLMWKDVHLTWEPSEYEDIKWLQIKSYEIWLPDIVVHTAGSSSGDDELPITSCWLYHKGDLYCVPSKVYSVHCDADRTWWPYETMNCTLQFGSWSHSIDELDFRFSDYVVDGLLTMEKYEKNLAWDIVRSYMTERVQVSKFGDKDTSRLMSYHIILRRHGSPYNASYVVPAIVLMIMTLLTLWLEPKSIERMTIANLNFVCHLLCNNNVNWQIPYSGTNCPNIVIVYETSLILSTFSLILTSILRHVQELTIEAPAWISSGTATLLRSKVGQILLISILDPKVSAEVERDADDNADLVVASDKKEVAWQYVTIIIGWIAFVTVLTTYFILFLLYLPTSNSGNTFFLNS